MRFHQLEIGQRFRFGGETWIKINTLVASSERTSHHRVIRRSAEVMPLPVEESAAPAGAMREETGQAMDAFRAEALAIFDAVAGGQDPQAARAELERALGRLAQALQPHRQTPMLGTAESPD